MSLKHQYRTFLSYLILPSPEKTKEIKNLWKNMNEKSNRQQVIDDVRYTSFNIRVMPMKISKIELLWMLHSFCLFIICIKLKGNCMDSVWRMELFKMNWTTYSKLIFDDKITEYGDHIIIWFSLLFMLF